MVFVGIGVLCVPFGIFSVLRTARNPPVTKKVKVVNKKNISTAKKIEVKKKIVVADQFVEVDYFINNKIVINGSKYKVNDLYKGKKIRGFNHEKINFIDGSFLSISK